MPKTWKEAWSVIADAENAVRTAGGVTTLSGIYLMGEGFGVRVYCDSPTKEQISSHINGVPIQVRNIAKWVSDEVTKYKQENP